jgi:hypothetical protein
MGNRQRGGNVDMCSLCFLPMVLAIWILDYLILTVDVTHHAPYSVFLQRNYRFFFMFVSSTTVLCIYVFAFCWVNLRRIMDTHQCKIGRALLKSPISGLLILYTFIAVWFVGGLTSFHLYLISTNQVRLFLSNWSNI